MRRKANAIMILALLASGATAAPARAFDLSGVWASDAGVCNKVFTRKGGKTAFTNASESFGSGFIINGRRLTGKTASCTINASRTEAEITHLIASCSNDVALSTMQFSVRALDENSIARFYPGVPELETRYYRCPGR